MLRKLLVFICIKKDCTQHDFYCTQFYNYLTIISDLQRTQNVSILASHLGTSLNYSPTSAKIFFHLRLSLSLPPQKETKLLDHFDEIITNFSALSRNSLKCIT